MAEQTFGEKAVGLQFNPSNLDSVAKCKKIYADAIDQLNDLRNSTDQGGVKRWCSTAITQTELAQMAAVKAITWKD
jgi:hypothetical protein